MVLREQGGTKTRICLDPGDHDTQPVRPSDVGDLPVTLCTSGGCEFSGGNSSKLLPGPHWRWQMDFGSQ